MSVSSAVEFVEWSKLAIVQPDAVSVHEWDLSTGRETRTWRERWPLDTFAVAQSADERWLLALGLKGSIWLVDRLTGGEVVRQLRIGLATDAAFSWDGKRFAAASWTGRDDGAKVWDTSTLRELAVLPTWSVSVAFSPDGKRIALGGLGKRAITLWDLDSQQGVWPGLFLRRNGPRFVQ